MTNIQLRHSLNGNVRQIIDGNGYSSFYEYDENNSLNKIIDAENNITSIRYSLLGSIAEIILPGESVKNFDYNAIDQLIYEKSKVSLQAQAAILQDFLSFGEVNCSETIQKRVKVYNIGVKPLEITNISVNNTTFTIIPEDILNNSISQGESKEFIIEFKAKEIGSQEAKVIISDNNAIDLAISTYSKVIT